MMQLQRAGFASACLGLIAVVALHAQGPGGGGAAGGRGRGQAIQLPDGPGKEMVQAVCVACHQLNMITGGAGDDRRAGARSSATMVALPDRTGHRHGLSRDELSGEARPQPTLVAGDATVTIKEWIAPTLGQRPRDPLQLADGTIWWAGMFASVVGRLNPATGEMREYKLAPDARPHSIINDRGRQHLVHGQRQRHGRPARSRAPATSRCIRCPIRPRAIRTRSIFDARARCGSRCRVRTWWAGSTLDAARSSSSRCRQPTRGRTAS